MTVRRAKRDGRSALLLFSQGGDWIERKLHRLEAMYRLGLRVLIPAYNRSNQICDGLLDCTDMGITRFGRLVVEECNRLGLLLDCTHVGKRATLEIIEHSAQPVIFSHSSTRAVCEHPRNVPEDVLSRLPDNGGICMITFVPHFVSPATYAWGLEVRAAAEQAGIDSRDLDALDAEDFVDIYRLNTVAAFQMVRAAAPAQKETAPSEGAVPGADS